MALDQASWIAIIAAGSSTVSAITAALIAGRSALQARAVDSREQRLKELESRNADKKGDLYQQIIETMGVFLDPAKATPEFMSTFEEKARYQSTWISIYGSDDAVSAYHNLISGALSVPIPPFSIILAMYANLILAVRRDLGYPDTKVAPNEVLSGRSFKLYISGLWPDAGLPLENLYKKHNWVPPWRREPEQWTAEKDSDVQRLIAGTLKPSSSRHSSR